MQESPIDDKVAKNEVRLNGGFPVRGEGVSRWAGPQGGWGKSPNVGRSLHLFLRYYMRGVADKLGFGPIAARTRLSEYEKGSETPLRIQTGDIRI